MIYNSTSIFALLECYAA